MLAPLLIAVAPNGARRDKNDHPRLPVTIDETAREAAACREAGAAMLHLHVRDGSGRHVLDAGIYALAISAVRREAGNDLLIQVTSEAIGLYSPPQQMAVIDALAPEAVSIALRELAPDDASLPRAAAFLEAHARRGTLIQYIIYDLADLARFESLFSRGVIPERGASQIFVLGRYAEGQLSSPLDLLPFLRERKRGLPWMVCAFGPREIATASAAAALEGHARVGFENNLWRPDGSLAQDNAVQIADLAEIAQRIGRRLVSPEEARKVLSGA